MEKKLSGAAIKWIAIITMLIDHIGAVILFPLLGRMTYGGYGPEEIELLNTIYTITRTIGRLAFPLFAFLIVEGFVHTRDIKKYGIRLFLFALISEIPFDLATQGVLLEGTGQNIYFTLTLGLVAMAVYEHFKEDNRFLGLAIALMISVLAEWAHVDYGFYGVLLMFVFYLYRKETGKMAIGFFILALYKFIEAIRQTGSMELSSVPLFYYLMYFTPLLTLPILAQYNGVRGKQAKYFFYLFYPVHLLILYFIGKMILQG